MELMKSKFVIYLRYIFIFHLSLLYKKSHLFYFCENNVLLSVLYNNIILIIKILHGELSFGHSNGSRYLVVIEVYFL
jgi:hypothetical protein